MKVSLFDLYSQKKYTRSFGIAANSNNNDLVNVPLVWDEEDSFKSTAAEIKEPSSTENTQKNSKFKKIIKNSSAIVGGIAVVPTAIEKTIGTVSSTIQNTSDSIKNSMDQVADIKTHAKDLFGKKHNENTGVDDKQDSFQHELASETEELRHDPFASHLQANLNKDIDGHNESFDKTDEPDIEDEDPNTDSIDLIDNYA